MVAGAASVIKWSLEMSERVTGLVGLRVWTD